MLSRRQLLPSRAHAPTRSRDSPRTSHLHPFLRLSLSSNRRFSSTGTYSTPPCLSITPTHSRTLALTPFAISPVVPSTLALSHLIACALHSPTRQAPNHSTLALRRTPVTLSTSGSLPGGLIATHSAKSQCNHSPATRSSRQSWSSTRCSQRHYGLTTPSPINPCTKRNNNHRPLPGGHDSVSQHQSHE